MTSTSTTSTVVAPSPPGAEWVRQRRLNVAAFLEERGLDFAELTAFMRERVGDGQVLLTSSPVHGLSNPTSDLDFIRIQAEPIEGARISTKIFDRGHHLEVVSFSAEELSRNLAELERLASLPPGDTVSGFRSWDRRFEPRRKQTERIVNGLTSDGEMPYLGSLPALGVVWARASLHTAIEQVVHLCLAEAAGETRGRVGYAVNALLHLADALLSFGGDVYTTRKWYLLRWARARLADTAGDPGVRAVAAELDALRVEVTGALTSHQRLAPRYVALCAEAARLIAGADEVTVSTTVDAEVDYHALLPGAGLLMRAGGGVVVVPGAEVPEGLHAPLERVCEVGSQQATGLLRAVRAGLAGNRLTYRQQEVAA
jgi:hypothetical protein